MRSVDDCEALDLDRADEDDTVSGCFEFRLRTRSFDLHQTPACNKLTKLASLLRTRSDGIVRSSSQPLSMVDTSRESPRLSPCASPCAAYPQRRRFIRVVRDQTEIDPDNPHVVHKYSSNFLQKQNLMHKSSSSDEYQSSPPYTVTGHTILKKQGGISSSGFQGGSIDPVTPEPSPTMIAKHASFRDEVEVMEYDKKEKIRRGPLLKRRVKLYDYTDAPLLVSRDEEDSEGNSGVDSPAGNSREVGKNERNETKTSVMEAINSSPSSSSSVKTSNIANTHAYIFSPIQPESQDTENRFNFQPMEMSAPSMMRGILGEENLGMLCDVRGVGDSTGDKKIVKSLMALDVNSEKPIHKGSQTSKTS